MTSPRHHPIRGSALAGALMAATLTAQTSFTDQFDISIRPRYEAVDRFAGRDASAATVRTGITYTANVGEAYFASIEIEDVRAVDPHSYNQAGLNPAGADRAVIADPVNRELNQLWASYQGGGVNARIGRQIIIFDNARFIGNVGWRQNMQTMDAARATYTGDDLTFDYVYLDRIRRVLGPDHPQGKWESDSHLLNIAWQVQAHHVLTGYAYRLNFGNAAVDSTATMGCFAAGSFPHEDLGDLTYRVEYATQEDSHGNPLSYQTTYLLIEAGLKFENWAVVLGSESLGTDNGVGFKTPLATAHAFNGWADRFLGTPADGLSDSYLKLSVDLPVRLQATLVYHEFKTAGRGTSLGREHNFSLARPFTKKMSGLLKWADFEGNSRQPDVQKFWAQVTMTF